MCACARGETRKVLRPFMLPKVISRVLAPGTARRITTMAHEATAAAPRLRGWEWLDSIGRPKWIVAPMVAQSELPFRMLCRQLGVDLCVTPMIPSGVWVKSPKRRPSLFRTCEGDRPLIAQIAGHDATVMLQTALDLQDHVDAIDINLGCPQGIARRGRYGAFLLTETDLLVDIVKTLDTGLRVPVTCKIRLLPSLDDTIALCKALQGAGCSLLTVHGRTKENKGHNISSVDWSAIKAIREAVDIPVWANGGVGCLADAERCIKETGVVGVMSSEGVLENPALFVNNIHPATGKRLNNLDIVEMYFDEVEKNPPPALKCIIAHMFRFLFVEMQDHPDLRAQLNEASGSREGLKALAMRVVERTRKCGIRDLGKWALPQYIGKEPPMKDVPVPAAVTSGDAGSSGTAAAPAGGGSGAGAGAGAGAGSGSSTPTVSGSEAEEAMNVWAHNYPAHAKLLRDKGHPIGGPWYMRHLIKRPHVKETSEAKLTRKRRKLAWKAEKKARARAAKKARTDEAGASALRGVVKEGSSA